MKRIWLAITLGLLPCWTVSVVGYPRVETDDEVRQSDESANSQARAAEIEKWIRLLGASDFEQRERATVELWRLGPMAEPALREAKGSADREISFRARKILERFRLGIFADTDPDQVRLIRSYASASDRDKQNMIRGMIGEAKIEEIMFLLDRESNENLRNQLSQYVAASLDQLIPRLKAEGKVDLADRALIRFSTTPTSQFLLASYAFSQGAQRYESLMQAVEDAWQEEDPNRLARQRVLGHLVAGQVDVALQELASMPDKLEARGWTNSIFLAEGRFGDLLEHLTEGKAAESFDLEAAGWLPQDLILAVWCARNTNEKQWQETLEPILNEWIKDEKLPLNQRIKLNLLTDRIAPSVQEAASTNKLLAFALMCYRDQFGEAFKQFEIGATRKEREEWYESLVADLKKLAEDNKNQRQQLTTDEERLRMAIEGAGWLASLGESEEAIGYLDTIFQAIPVRLSSARMYQYRILELEFRNQFDTTFCDHVIALMSKARFEQSFAQINSVDRDGYTFWWWALEAEAPEPPERLKIIRNLLLDPRTEPIPEPQLRNWLSIAEDYYGPGQQSAAKVASPSVVLAETCFKHHLTEDGFAYLADAIEAALRDGDRKRSTDGLNAAQRLAEWHAEREEWEESERATSQWLQLKGSEDKSGGAKRATLSWGQVHRIACLRKMGQNPEAQQLLDELYADNYSVNQLSALARSLDDEGLYSDSHDLWKRLCYQPGKDFRPLAAYSYPALIGLANVVLDDPQQGDPLWVESFLGYMLADNNDWYLRGSINSMHPVVALLNFREQANQAYAHHLLKAGEIPKAVRHLERALTARPGNVDNVVSFVESLESADAQQDLLALFGVSRQLHLKVLSEFPESAMHHNNLAWLCARTRQELDEALVHAQQATHLRPTEDTYWDTLAEVQFQRGDLKTALELAEKCVQMNPLYPHYQTQLKKYRAALAQEQEAP